jgi:biopolymer transport protein TolQ
MLQMQASPAEGKNVLHLLFSTDPVVKVTLLILIFFSVFSWAIILYKYRQVKKAKKSAIQFLKVFDHSYTIDEVLTKQSPQEGNPLYEVFTSGVSDVLRHRQLASKEPGNMPKLNLEHVKKNVDRATSDEVAKLEQLIPFLATTASASPFIGLFGTVWGILTAFWAIGRAGSTSLATVGPFIAEALIATAVGLAAAIPAVIAYNYFVTKIKVLTKELDDFSTDLVHRIEKNISKRTNKEYSDGTLFTQRRTAFQNHDG